EAEDKLRAILSNSKVPSEVKEACTWGRLALGMHFAHRQAELQNHRVLWLQNLAKLHRSAVLVLASNLTELKEKQEMECNEVTFQLQLTQTSLVEVQREQDVLRWKLFCAVRSPERSLPSAPALPQPTWTPALSPKRVSALSTSLQELASPQGQGQAIVFPGLATAGGAWKEGADEQEKEVATAGAAGGGGEERYAEAGPALAEVLRGLGEGFRQPLGAVEQTNYTFGAGGGRSQILKSSQETGETLNPMSREDLQYISGLGTGTAHGVKL
ncbi:Testis-expressed protein 13B, partial [Saguinus oedipus]